MDRQLRPVRNYFLWLLCLLRFRLSPFPGFAKPVDPYWFDSAMAVFELGLSFWLLSKGLKSSGMDDRRHLPALKIKRILKWTGRVGAVRVDVKKAR
jgi:hypothetical protein